MHLRLTNIKAESFGTAESNVDMIKVLLEFDGAPEIFVNSSNFYRSGMTGYEMQIATYFGRYLTFSALPTET